jgi:Ca2+-binding EF-hand superfamily protein
MKKLLVTVALGATVVSTQAFAQDERGGHGGWMQKDVTRQQAQQMADTLFQRLDANHDGVLTRQEADQAAAQFGDRGQHMVDRLFGGAQSVTLQQAEAQALARFDRQDLNHDGVVTAAERQQMRAQRQAERGEKGQ